MIVVRLMEGLQIGKQGTDLNEGVEEGKWPGGRGDSEAGVSVGLSWPASHASSLRNYTSAHRWVGIFLHARSLLFACALRRMRTECVGTQVGHWKWSSNKQNQDRAQPTLSLLKQEL